MQTVTAARSDTDLESLGIRNVRAVHWNLSTPLLYEEAVRRREGRLVHLGPLVVRTGQYTGRSPRDKFIVRESSSEKNVDWGAVNQPLEPAHFTTLLQRLLAYLQGRELFVQDCFAGADPTFRLPIRVITESAWHNLFARTMFIQASPEQLAEHVPEFTVIHAPSFHAIPKIDGIRSEAFIVLNFAERLLLIGGTQYAGEIKKSVFTLLNYLLPLQGVLGMHSAANFGPDGDVAIFFGLSGTGKTALSADPSRTLIGDDEHGWSDRGIFNFEGGCYAKVIRLSSEDEPDIYQTTRRFGTILENVGFDSDSGRLDLNDDSLTENTRAAYPISHVQNATRAGTADHPANLILLTADAFGVLPPIARLTPAQAIYYFLSGYTAKVAGTERGVTEPQATFSACFGAPFMPLPPTRYGMLLAEKIARHAPNVWLVNTGWSGGPYGVGQRIKIGYTRAMLRAALSGALESAPLATDPTFSLGVPTACPEVPAHVLSARATWADKAAYDAQARKLAAMFTENFRQFADQVSAEVAASGPKET